jgi:hypothetical protein
VIAASVLNPFYWRDMRRGWWWRNAIRSLGTGSLRFSGDVTTYRHFVRTVKRMAAPDFTLIEREPPSRNAFSANFLILVLRKRD